MFTWEKNKKTYFFSESHYWRYDENRGQPDTGYPKGISRGWPSLPKDIDAAVNWSNKYSYIFKGNEYWKLENVVRRGKVYHFSGYPREISKVWMKCKTESVGALAVGALQGDP